MRQWLILSLTGVSVVLTGCDGFRKTLGLEKDAPDEFAVVSRAPISLPPEFNTLPSPQTPKHGHNLEDDVIGAPDKRPQEETPQLKAQKSVLGQTLQTPMPQKSGLTLGETAFIGRVDESLKSQGVARESVPNIRGAVDEETHFKTDNKKSWVKKLLFWQKGDAAQRKEALNPSQEYQNLYGTLPGEAAVTQ